MEMSCTPVKRVFAPINIDIVLQGEQANFFNTLSTFVSPEFTKQELVKLLFFAGLRYYFKKEGNT